MPEVLKNVDIIFISIDDSYKLLNKVNETKSIYKMISLVKKIEETSLKID
jgi:hypothetical protein